MKTLFKTVFILLLLQACSTSQLSKYVTSEFKDNRASYHIFPYKAGDSRAITQDHDILCQLDKFSYEELSEELNILSFSGSFGNEIKKPILKTSFEDLASPEIEAYLEKNNYDGSKVVKLFVNLSCIGFDFDELQVTVTAEIKSEFDTTFLWKTTETSTKTIPDVNISAKQWNDLICNGIKAAVRKCLNSIPK
jgi:hypothetical protein